MEGPAPPAAIGLSGFEAVSDSDLGWIADRFRESTGVESLAMASDGLTALLGAIGRRDGVVVAAGTGTACLARRGERFAKVDGWDVLHLKGRGMDRNRTVAAGRNARLAGWCCAR